MTDIPDIIAAADLKEFARLYRAREERGFELVLKAASVVGKKAKGDTIKIAEAAGCSVDTVERLARTGRTVSRLSRAFPQAAEGWLEGLTVDHFSALSRRVEADIMDNSECAEKLDEAVRLRMPVEKFRAKLPELPGPVLSYKDRCLKYSKKLDGDLIHAPFTDVDEAKAVKVSEAAQILLDAVGELLEGGEA